MNCEGRIPFDPVRERAALPNIERITAAARNLMKYKLWFVIWGCPGNEVLQKGKNDGTYSHGSLGTR